jgi:transporter family protein
MGRRATVTRGDRMRALFSSWQAFAVASAVFAALTAIFGKLGVARMSSDLATFVRTVVILAVTALVITARSEWQRPQALSLGGVAALALSGVATGLSWLCYYRALQLGPASRVAPVDKLSVVFVLILSVVALGEPLTWKVALGGALITAGAVLIATA